MKCFLLFFALFSTSLFAAELKDFEFDGCTLFVDGTRDQPKLWSHCCLMHDLKYWIGGEKTKLDLADLALKQCVTKAAGKYWADLIYVGVRTGHHSPIKNKYSWSWGWSPKRAYSKLDEKEIDYIIEKFSELNFESKYTTQALAEYFVE